MKCLLIIKSWICFCFNDICRVKILYYSFRRLLLISLRGKYIKKNRGNWILFWNVAGLSIYSFFILFILLVDINWLNSSHFHLGWLIIFDRSVSYSALPFFFLSYDNIYPLIFFYRNSPYKNEANVINTISFFSYIHTFFSYTTPIFRLTRLLIYFFFCFLSLVFF